MVAASTEQDNNQPVPGKERHFYLCKDCPVYEEDGELFIRFEYRQTDSKMSQEALNQTAVQRILKFPGFDDWLRELSKPDPTKKNENRTVLEKHLFRYTTRNTLDYFIHKDLGGFLRRELDFYIKNEVMYLDDIEHESAPRVDQYLSQIRVIRNIAHKIIQFLEQLEDFQKRLWLKKKFVLETNYCVTLDRIPEAMYAEIATNNGQREEWVRLLAINEIKKSNDQPGYSSALTVEFLKARPCLTVDTKFFDKHFQERLLASLDNLDQACDGIYIHADNFQALLLLQKRFQKTIKCFYIDPPYNTGSSAILYKNSYKHSSWCTMMRDRLALSRTMLKEDGAMFVSIDKTERTVLEYALDEVFGADNHIEELIWTQATANSQLPNYSTNHEYVEVYARDRNAVESDKDMFREPKPGYSEVMELLARIQQPRKPAPF